MEPSQPMALEDVEVGLEKLHVKMGVEAPAGIEWEFLLAVFGRWRLEEGEEIVDLADYAHVPEGPSFLLVSKRWHFGVDFARGCGLGRAGGWGGLFYSSRKGLHGALEERLRGVLKALLLKSQRLLGEPETPGGLALQTGELDIVVNDRLLVPNSPEVDARIRPAVEAVLASLYGRGGYEIEQEADPARRLGYSVRARRPEPLEGLLERFG